MIHQDLYLGDAFNRFELTDNSSERAAEKAFNLYGVLIIPTLLGGILMYDLFQLRDEYFVVSFLLMVVVLINLYFFYRTMTYGFNPIKMIIQEDYIQLLDKEQVYFQDDLKRINIEIILCGRQLQPAIRLSGKNFQGVVIGLKDTKIDRPIEVKNKLCLPDYWMLNQNQSNQLMSLIDQYNLSIC